MEGGGQEGGEGLGFVLNNRGDNAWAEGGNRRSDTFRDYKSRIRRQQAEELGVVMEEEKEVEPPLLPWHHRRSVGEATSKVEDRAEREEEERRPR